MLNFKKIKKIFLFYSNKKTVGKTYMACAGLKTEFSKFDVKTLKSSTKRVLDLAISIMNYIQTVAWG